MSIFFTGCKEVDAPTAKTCGILRQTQAVLSLTPERNVRRENHDLPLIVAEEITHFVRYREDVATSDQVGIDQDVWRAFEPVADWIERFIPSKTEPLLKAATKNLKQSVLTELQFSVGTAEQQEELIQDFVLTENVRDALSSDVPLVLGRKGTGKTAIFRYVSESPTKNSVVVHAPKGLEGENKWLLSVDAFKEIDEIISKTNLEWRHFWMLYIGVAVEQHNVVNVPRPDYLTGRDFSSQTAIIDAFEATAEASRGTLSLAEWIQKIDRSMKAQMNLLLDGLDTGFGSTEEERNRRRRSIEGLFGAWMDLGQGLEYLLVNE